MIQWCLRDTLNPVQRTIEILVTRSGARKIGFHWKLNHGCAVESLQRFDPGEARNGHVNLTLSTGVES
jgi:hypothetical protein